MGSFCWMKPAAAGSPCVMRNLIAVRISRGEKAAQHAPVWDSSTHDVAGNPGRRSVRAFSAFGPRSTMWSACGSLRWCSMTSTVLPWPSRRPSTPAGVHVADVQPVVAHPGCRGLLDPAARQFLDQLIRWASRRTASPDCPGAGNPGRLVHDFQDLGEAARSPGPAASCTSVQIRHVAPLNGRQGLLIERRRIPRRALPVGRKSMVSRQPGPSHTGQRRRRC